eukprot:15455053-Alexandrium_andersonii.AAC.1
MVQSHHSIGADTRGAELRVATPARGPGALRQLGAVLRGLAEVPRAQRAPRAPRARAPITSHL